MQFDNNPRNKPPNYHYQPIQPTSNFNFNSQPSIHKKTSHLETINSMPYNVASNKFGTSTNMNNHPPATLNRTANNLNYYAISDNCQENKISKNYGVDPRKVNLISMPITDHSNRCKPDYLQNFHQMPQHHKGNQNEPRNLYISPNKEKQPSSPLYKASKPPNPQEQVRGFNAECEKYQFIRRSESINKDNTQYYNHAKNITQYQDNNQHRNATTDFNERGTCRESEPVSSKRPSKRQSLTANTDKNSFKMQERKESFEEDKNIKEFDINYNNSRPQTNNWLHNYQRQAKNHMPVAFHPPKKTTTNTLDYAYTYKPMPSNFEENPSSNPNIPLPSFAIPFSQPPTFTSSYLTKRQSNHQKQLTATMVSNNFNNTTLSILSKNSGEFQKQIQNVLAQKNKEIQILKIKEVKFNEEIQEKNKLVQEIKAQIKEILQKADIQKANNQNLTLQIQFLKDKLTTVFEQLNQKQIKSQKMNLKINDMEQQILKNYQKDEKINFLMKQISKNTIFLKQKENQMVLKEIQNVQLTKKVNDLQVSHKFIEKELLKKIEQLKIIDQKANLSKNSLKQIKNENQQRNERLEDKFRMICLENKELHQKYADLLATTQNTKQNDKNSNDHHELHKCMHKNQQLNKQLKKINGKLCVLGTENHQLQKLIKQLNSIAVLKCLLQINEKYRQQ